MCGRFALACSPARIKAQFGTEELPLFKARYNIAPSQDILILMQTPDSVVHGEPLLWGFIPFFAKDEQITPPILNARAETVATKPAFRQAFKMKRGLVVMSGFFEWCHIEGKKQPYYISKNNNELLAVAALWESWQAPEGEVVRSCCMITTQSNPLIKNIHERMPVILTPEQQKIWLDTTRCDKEQLLSFLTPYSGQDLQYYQVTPKMNTWRYDVLQAIKPLH